MIWESVSLVPYCTNPRVPLGLVGLDEIRLVLTLVLKYMATAIFFPIFINQLAKTQPEDYI